MKLKRIDNELSWEHMILTNNVEILDLYTKDRTLAGITMKRGEQVPEGLYRLIVHVCIFNSKGELLIQQRQPFKQGWSNLWDLSVGGSAVSGDTSALAAEREVKEELGLHLPLEGTRPALTVYFKDGFDDFYIVEKDIDLTDLTLQYEEVQDVKWATKEDIIRLVDEGLFLPWHKSLIDMLFYMRNHNQILTGRD